MTPQLGLWRQPFGRHLGKVIEPIKHIYCFDLRVSHFQCFINYSPTLQRGHTSDVNKDLGFKAKAKAKDLSFKVKAKAKDLSFKPRTRLRTWALRSRPRPRPRTWVSRPRTWRSRPRHRTWSSRPRTWESVLKDKQGPRPRTHHWVTPTLQRGLGESAGEFWKSKLETLQFGEYLKQNISDSLQYL